MSSGCISSSPDGPTIRLRSSRAREALDQPPPRGRALALRVQGQRPDGGVGQRRLARVEPHEALGRHERVAARPQHAPHLAGRARHVPRAAEVLDRRQREHDVEAPVRERQLAGVGVQDLQPVLPVRERRVRGRVGQHRRRRLALGERALAVDVGGHHPPDPVREPEDHPLVARPDRQRRGLLAQAPGLLQEQGEHRELPDLALHVRERVALGQDLAQHPQDVRVLEVADVAELRESASLEAVDLEQVRPAGAVRRQARRDPDLVARARESAPRRAAAAHASISAVVPSGSWFSSPRTPQSRQHRRTTSGRGESASTGRLRPVGRDHPRRAARHGRDHERLQPELVARRRRRRRRSSPPRRSPRSARSVRKRPYGSSRSVAIGDRGHHRDRLDRVAADRRLLGQHHGVGAVEDRVRHVGHLGAGRAGGLHHRLEHLGGRDRGLQLPARDVEDPLLDERHLLDRELDARGRRARPSRRRRTR